MSEVPAKSYCESHEHVMCWWGLPFGQFEVCVNCSFAVTYPAGAPVETEWSMVYDGVTGEPLPDLAHWMPTERSVRWRVYREVT